MAKELESARLYGVKSAERQAVRWKHAHHQTSYILVHHLVLQVVTEVSRWG